MPIIKLKKAYGTQRLMVCERFRSFKANQEYNITSTELKNLKDTGMIQYFSVQKEPPIIEEAAVEKPKKSYKKKVDSAEADSIDTKQE
jgi:hypothetical protein